MSPEPIPTTEAPELQGWRRWRSWVSRWLTPVLLCVLVVAAFTTFLVVNRSSNDDRLTRQTVDALSADGKITACRSRFNGKAGEKFTEVTRATAEVNRLTSQYARAAVAGNDALLARTDRELDTANERQTKALDEWDKAYKDYTAAIERSFQDPELFLVECNGGGN